MKITDPKIQKLLKESGRLEWDFLSAKAFSGMPLTPHEFDRYKELKVKFGD